MCNGFNRVRGPITKTRLGDVMSHAFFQACCDHVEEPAILRQL